MVIMAACLRAGMGLSYKYGFLQGADQNGVAVVKYDNDHTIYVNYNNRQVNHGTITLEPYQYMVEGGSNA